MREKYNALNSTQSYWRAEMSKEVIKILVFVNCLFGGLVLGCMLMEILFMNLIEKGMFTLDGKTYICAEIVDE